MPKQVLLCGVLKKKQFWCSITETAN